MIEKIKAFCKKIGEFFLGPSNESSMKRLTAFACIVSAIVGCFGVMDPTNVIALLTFGGAILGISAFTKS